MHRPVARLDSGCAECGGVFVQCGAEQLVEAGDEGAVVRACSDEQAVGETCGAVCADHCSGRLGVEAGVEGSLQVFGGDAAREPLDEVRDEGHELLADRTLHGGIVVHVEGDVAMIDQCIAGLRWLAMHVCRPAERQHMSEGALELVGAQGFGER